MLSIWFSFSGKPSISQRLFHTHLMEALLRSSFLYPMENEPTKTNTPSTLTELISLWARDADSPPTFQSSPPGLSVTCEIRWRRIADNGCPLNAIILFEVWRIGLLPQAKRPLAENERRPVRSASAFVWDEWEAKIWRYTDGKSLNASRVSGSLLMYLTYISRIHSL